MILVKAGIKNLNLFNNTEFEYFEAYTDYNDDLNQLLKTHMQMKVLHLTNRIALDENYYSLNLNDDGKIGIESWKKLKEAIDFANEFNIEYIVLHSGFLDIDKENKSDVINKLALKMCYLDSGTVKICLENVPHWIDLSFEKEPIISSFKDMMLFKENCNSVGFTIDIDHIAIDTVFNSFLDTFKNKYKDKKEIRNFIKQSLIELHKNPNNHLEALVDKNISVFMDNVRPDIIHACGSDYYKYFTPDRLPLIGEGLPLQFNGKIKSHNVKDRINHSLWISKIETSMLITIELIHRNDYSYIDQINKSINYFKLIYNSNY